MFFAMVISAAVSYIGPRNCDVDALLEGGLDLLADAAQAGRVEVGEVDEVGPVQRRDCR